MVVVSEDLTFLTTFARRSLKVGLVTPVTKLLALTDFSLINNPEVSRVFSKMNAMLLVVEEHKQLQR